MRTSLAVHLCKEAINQRMLIRLPINVPLPDRISLRVDLYPKLYLPDSVRYQQWSADKQQIHENERTDGQGQLGVDVV